MKEKTIFSPKVPFEIDENDNFMYNSDTLSSIKQNLKMIILTSPGEKLQDPIFGLGIMRLLFEAQDGILKEGFTEGERPQLEDINSYILTNLTFQVQKYLPEVNIDDIIISFEEKLINILVKYNYKEYVSDTITLTVGQ